MRARFGALVLGISLLGAASTGEAYPLLQLDIIGGTYDFETDTIISSGSSFTLIALLTPRSGSSVHSVTALLADTYFISAAVSPQIGPVGSSIGSFSWNGTSYQVTQDMTFGTPPLEGLHDATTDPGDLSTHDVFPTYFSEIPLNFSSANQTVAYNTQDRAIDGTPVNLAAPSAGDEVAYYQLFNVTTSLTGGYELHFDLYDTYMKTQCLQGTCNADEDIDHFAPFTHDAQSGTQSVPEPGSFLLLLLGLPIVGYRMHRNSASRVAPHR